MPIFKHRQLYLNYNDAWIGVANKYVWLFAPKTYQELQLMLESNIISNMFRKTMHMEMTDTLEEILEWDFLLLKL